MSPIIFWLALATAIFMASMLTGAPRHDAFSILASALLWVAVVALVWTRWVKYSAEWLARLAAVLVLAMLALTLWEWLPRDDVFVIYRKNCPPRMGTFWPLFMLWLAGPALAVAGIWGKRFEWHSSLRTRTIEGVAFWTLATVWTLVCAYVLAKNLSLDVVKTSLFTSGKLVAIIVLSIGGMLLIGFLFSLPGQRLAREVAADYERMSPADRDSILAAIDTEARRSEYALLYRPAALPGDTTTLAKIGGLPLGRTGETWPMNDDASPGLFLLQLPLAAPRLGAAWQDRVASIFLAEHELQIRTYRLPVDASISELESPGGQDDVVEQPLTPLAIPVIARASTEEDDEPSDMDGESLLACMPQLGRQLEPFTKHPARLLDRIIAGSGLAGSASLDGEIIVGGQPAYIQSEHEPTCCICGQRMRFLLQFGDVTESFQFGDAGVGYVYGCDAHPEHCQGFVDFC